MRNARLLLEGALLLLSYSLVAQQTPEANKWKLGLGYRLGFNVGVEFENSGSVPAPNNPSVTGRSYADGFVGTDSTTNALDLTTFWGFDRADQVAGGSLLLRNSQPGPFGKDEPFANGFEVSLARQFGQSRYMNWGVEAAYGYSRLDASWAGDANIGTLSLDAFPLGGIIPPMSPYAGPQTAGPGVPLLGTTATTVPLSVMTQLDATIYAFRIGPYFEFPLGRRLSVSVAGGLSLAAVDSSLDLREIAPSPYSSASRSIQGGDSDALLGGYANAMLTAKMREGMEIFTGVQYHALGDSEQTLSDKKVRLDMGSTLNWVIGIGFRF